MSEYGGSRPIKTYFYNHKREVLRVNSGVHIDWAVPRAVWHMQIDHYSARVCEVVDESTGVVWAVVVRHTDRKVSIAYKQEIPRPKPQ